jgi:hypothetical protein
MRSVDSVVTLLAGRGGVGLTDMGRGRGEAIEGLEQGLIPELLRMRDDEGVPKFTSSLIVICIPSYGESSTMIGRLGVLGEEVERFVCMLRGRAGSSFELDFDLVFGGGVLARLV